MQTPTMVHEEFITRLRTRNPSGELEDDVVLDRLERAFKSARDGAERIAAVVAAVAKDPTVTPASAAMKAKQTALSVGEQAAAALDKAKAAATEALAELTATLAGPPPPDDQIDIALEGEVRGRLAAMSRADRDRIIADAIKAGDDKTVGAVLRAPAWVTGMSATEIDLRRHEWQVARYPREAAALKRWKSAIEATERAGQSLVAFVKSVADDPKIAVTEAAARHASESIAAAEAFAKQQQGGA